MTYSAALKILPQTICYDALRDTTVKDLIYLAQHELDLYSEGEENNLDTPEKVREVIRFINRVRG